MNLLSTLGGIAERSRMEYEAVTAGGFSMVEDLGDDGNLLARGDNLAFLLYLRDVKNMSGKIQSIYVDPPFFTNSKYLGTFSVTEDLPAVKPEAYDDQWTAGMEEYLSMLAVRLRAMRDLLAEDGLFWIHLDWHVVHYVKVLMDEIFGSDHFINEIIWQYKSGGSSKKHFARKHDTILLYSRSKGYQIHVGREKSYNRGHKPYRFKGVEEFCDDLGWYTMVNQKDVWQIDMVGRTSSERTGYATQKPLALMERIIESSSREGDLVADFFSGAGGFAEVAEKLGRQWICCDMGSLAIGVTQKRLAGDGENPKAARYSLMTEDGELERGVRLAASAGILDGEGGGSPLLSIHLDRYEIDVDQLPISDKEKKELAVTDLIQLIDYWSVDLHYDGVVHRPQRVVTKGKGRIETALVMETVSTDEISIRVIDVFGNSTRITVPVT